VPSNTFVEWRIVKCEPEESVFVLAYEYRVGADRYREEKQISIRQGDRLFRSVSTFWKNGGVAAGLPVAVGLATHGGRAVPSKDLSVGWMACWEEFDGSGLGTGVVMAPSAIEGYRLVESREKDAAHALLLTRTDARGQVEYFAGYGWERGGIESSRDWENYLAAFPAWAAGEFRQERILERMEAAAGWQLANPFGYGELQWHCAPFYMGLSDLSEVSGDRKYIDAAKAVGERHGWALGRRKYHADDHAVGQVYLKLHALDRDPAMVAALRERFDWILEHPPKPDYWIRKQRRDGKWIETYNGDRWTWCDALYMGTPVWVGLWRATGEGKYLDFAVREWRQTSDWLWDDAAGLYYRDKNFVGKTSGNGAKIFWARGNGWVFGGLAEVLQYLPPGHPDRPMFGKRFRRMAAALKAIQKGNGTWAPNLLDPEHPAQDETSGTAFYVYGLAWGINQGLLDRAEYEPVVRRGWRALCERQLESGRLANVQPVAAKPGGFDPDSTVVYGVGAFISAGSEVWKMVGTPSAP